MTGLHMHLEEAISLENTVLTVCGDLDLMAAPQLQAALNAYRRAKCPALVLDLSQVQFMDSSGLSQLIAYKLAAAEFAGSFRIAAPHPEVQQLLTIARLDQFFSIYPSVEDACGKSSIAT
jgi:anti-sigma B factor antagonist